jgi:hypothetical protein
MSMARRIGVSLLAMVFAGSGIGGAVAAQTTASSATTAPASPAASRSAPAVAASAPATRAKRPAAAEILSRKRVPFDFVAAPLNDVLQFMGKNFDVGIENAYDLPDLVNVRNTLDAKQAIDILNTSLQPVGYSVVESVRDDQGTPRVFLTVTQIKKDAGNMMPVFRGMDPAAIPEGEEIRTQIMTVKNLDLEKYRGTITSVCKDATLEINAETKTLIITDTGTHIHTLAVVLQVLDNQAAAGGK